MWRLRTHLLLAAGALALAAFFDRFGKELLAFGGRKLLTGALAIPLVVIALAAQKKSKRVGETVQRLLPVVKGPLRSAISENPRISSHDLGTRLLTAGSGRIADRGILKELTTNMDTLLPALVRSLRASGDLAVDWDAMPPTGSGGFSTTAQWTLSGYLVVFFGAVIAGLPLLHPANPIHGHHRDMTPMILIGVGIMGCGAAGVVISEWWARRSRRRSSSATLAYQRTD